MENPFIKRNTKLLIICSIGCLLGLMLIWKPAPHDRILNIQNYLITVGGIISAFVTAYLAAKIFNIRAERENRQVEIDRYSEKLTDFRRLLYYVMTSREFWVHYGDIAKFKKKYPGLTYEQLRGQPLDEMAKKVYEDTDLCFSTVSLYCAMEAIYGDASMTTGSAWALDKAASFDYSEEDLIKFHDPSNQIWYYLEGRFGKHGAGRFTDTGMNPLWKSYVDTLLPKIDMKYRGKEFHRNILAEVATETYEYTIPILLRLVRNNVGVPKALIKTFRSLFFIMVFGVVLPISIQSLSLSAIIDTSSTLFCVWTTVLSIILFMFDFFNFLEEDVHIRPRKKGKQN